METPSTPDRRTASAVARNDGLPLESDTNPRSSMAAWARSAWRTRRFRLSAGMENDTNTRRPGDARCASRPSPDFWALRTTSLKSACTEGCFIRDGNDGTATRSGLNWDNFPRARRAASRTSCTDGRSDPDCCVFFIATPDGNGGASAAHATCAASSATATPARLKRTTVPLPPGLPNEILALDGKLLARRNDGLSPPEWE